jgi:hypothetical protein
MKILKRIWLGFRYGLVLKYFLDRLGSIGIQITPYYWVLEGLNDNSLPKLTEHPDGLTFEFFGPQEMKIIGTIPGRAWNPEKNLLFLLNEGKKCFGAKYRGEIAAFTWFDFNGNSCRTHKLRLNNREAYLFDMYTMKPFRGMDIAPYLRYRNYLVLREMGREQYYSISEFFNIPSIRFKKKLNAKILELRLDIKLFKKYYWNWKIKDHRS